MRRGHRSRRAAAALACAALAVGCAVIAPPRDPAAMAHAYLEADRVEEAVREIDLAVRTHPTDAKLRCEAARIHARSGHLESAIAHLDVALELAPSDPEVSIELGDLERRRENLSEAYVAFRRAVKLAPDDLRAVSGLALAADALGFEDEAEQAYARWAEIEGREVTP